MLSLIPNVTCPVGVPSTNCTGFELLGSDGGVYPTASAVLSSDGSLLTLTAALPAGVYATGSQYAWSVRWTWHRSQHQFVQRCMASALLCLAGLAPCIPLRDFRHSASAASAALESGPRAARTPWSTSCHSDTGSHADWPVPRQQRDGRLPLSWRLGELMPCILGVVRRPRSSGEPAMLARILASNFVAHPTHAHTQTHTHF